MDDVWTYDHSTGNWTWIAGSNNAAAGKVSGTQGVYGPTVSPGARVLASMTTHNNSLYLQGGFTWYSGFHSDMWQFDPTINQWRWIKGPVAVNQTGIYGFENTEDAAGVTYPGGRYDAKFQNINSKFYFFAGRGYSGTSTSSDESQNDLWDF